MNPIGTTALDTNQDNTRPLTLRRLGVALLGLALISATSCGSDPGTEATGAATPTSAVINAPAPTTPPPTTTSATTTTTPRPSTTVQASPSATPRPMATIDQLVGVEGGRVHVRCTGDGETTVLLIAGFGGDSSGWVNVEPAITDRARVCSYDRPGTGTSDPATATEAFSTQASDLHALLSTIGEPGPYVVVGHSFGGAQAVTFASMYPDEVTGLVLVDASPTTWPAALCAVPDDGSAAAATVLGNCSGAFLATGNPEHLDVTAAFAEVSSIASLGSLPMAVVTATERELPAGLAAAEVARLTDVWNQGQQDWMALTTAAQLVTVEHTSHHIEIDQPGIVIDEITRLLP